MSSMPSLRAHSIRDKPEKVSQMSPQAAAPLSPLWEEHLQKRFGALEFRSATEAFPSVSTLSQPRASAETLFDATEVNDLVIPKKGVVGYATGFNANVCWSEDDVCLSEDAMSGLNKSGEFRFHAKENTRPEEFGEKTLNS